MSSQLKRLLFQSHHRGTKEMDLVLGRFADACLAGLSDSELADYAALLDQQDPDLTDWLLERRAPPPQVDTPMFRRVLAFARAACTVGA
jgi:antitoxin CptB